MLPAAQAENAWNASRRGSSSEVPGRSLHVYPEIVACFGAYLHSSTTAEWSYPTPVVYAVLVHQTTVRSPALRMRLASQWRPAARAAISSFSEMLLKVVFSLLRQIACSSSERQVLALSVIAPAS